MIAKGWARIGNARLFHYYDRENRSFCGKYVALFAPADAFDPDSRVVASQECKPCRTALDKKIVSLRES